jgi:hypothetical protein
VLHEIRKALFVNAEFGSGYPTADGASDLVSISDETVIRKFLEELKKETGVETRYIAPKSRGELKNALLLEMNPNVLVFSTDHAVAYAILKALWRHGWKVDMDIVFDQHMDIYSYQTHGKLLTKANPYRFALNFGLLKFVLFLGIRKLEEAFLEPYILLPEVLTFKRSPLDLLYALYQNHRGQHDGLKNYFNERPVANGLSFAEMTKEALRVFDAYREAGYAQRDGVIENLRFDSFAFEIDLDVFDSQKIHGVDYGPKLQRRIMEDMRRRFQERKRKNYWAALRGFIYEYWVASYVKHKIECPGVTPPDENDCRRVAQILRNNRSFCQFIHITEFKPEFDDPGCKTTALVKNLAIALIEESRKI